MNALTGAGIAAGGRVNVRRRFAGMARARVAGAARGRQLSHVEDRMISFRTGALALITIALPASVIACGGKVVVDLEGGIGTAGAGGVGGGTGAGAGNVGGAASCLLGTNDAGPDQIQVVECFTKPSAGCPSQYQAVEHILPSTPCVYLVSVDCGPFAEGDTCCYVVTEEKKPCGA